MLLNMCIHCTRCTRCTTLYLLGFYSSTLQLHQSIIMKQQWHRLSVCMCVCVFSCILIVIFKAFCPFLGIFKDQNTLYGFRQILEPSNYFGPCNAQKLNIDRKFKVKKTDFFLKTFSKKRTPLKVNFIKFIMILLLN